jgi:hypothetical protein
MTVQHTQQIPHPSFHPIRVMKPDPLPGEMVPFTASKSARRVLALDSKDPAERKGSPWPI